MGKDITSEGKQGFDSGRYNITQREVCPCGGVCSCGNEGYLKKRRLLDGKPADVVRQSIVRATYMFGQAINVLARVPQDQAMSPQALERVTRAFVKRRASQKYALEIYEKGSGGKFKSDRCRNHDLH